MFLQRQSRCHVPINWSIFVSVYPSACPSSIHPSTHMSICPCVHLTIDSLSVHPSIQESVRLSIRPPIHFVRLSFPSIPIHSLTYSFIHPNNVLDEQSQVVFSAYLALHSVKCDNTFQTNTHLSVCLSIL